MKASKITPWVIFGLVLIIAWMTLGESSGYYDAPPGTIAAMPAAPTAPAVASITTTQMPPAAAPTAPAAASITTPATQMPPAAAYTNRAWTVNHVGNTIKSLNVNDRQQCATECNNSPGCVGFVMNARENRCWLKNKMANPTRNWNRRSFALPSTILSTPLDAPRPRKVCMSIGY